MKAKVLLVEGGSITIGVEAAGFKVDEVLMVGEEADQWNTRHAKHNRPDIGFLPPSAWENKAYFDGRKAENFDFMFAVPPCSGLSQINRNAKADSATNDHFYRTFDALDAMAPKTFAIENAPTLTSKGIPILKRMTDRLKDTYNLTVLSDKGGRHGVGMRRSRTMVVGWRRDFFDDKIPIIWDRAEPQKTVRDIIGDLSEDLTGTNVPNHNTIGDGYYDDKLELIAICRERGLSFSRALVAFHKENPGEVLKRWGEKVERDAIRLTNHVDNGTLLWDKSASCLEWDGIAHSMTSLSQWIHPSGKRVMTYREMARFMGYTDDFVYVEDCLAPKIQCMAQGVPANFVKWISKNCFDAITDDRPRLAARAQGKVLVYQNNPANLYAALSEDEVTALPAMRIEHMPGRQKMPIEGTSLPFA